MKYLQFTSNHGTQKRTTQFINVERASVAIEGTMANKGIRVLVSNETTPKPIQVLSLATLNVGVTHEGLAKVLNFFLSNPDEVVLDLNELEALIQKKTPLTPKRAAMQEFSRESSREKSTTTA